MLSAFVNNKCCAVGPKEVEEHRAAVTARDTVSAELSKAWSGQELQNFGE